MARSDQRRIIKQGEKEKRDIDLGALVEASKLGKPTNGVIFEIHPKTLKDDPLLRTSGGTLPPSQDEAFMKFVAVNLPPPPRARRTNPRGQTQRQEQKKSSWRHHITWEGLLRSKRR
jgi:Ca2+-transporting ATPase